MRDDYLTKINGIVTEKELEDVANNKDFFGLLTAKDIPSRVNRVVHAYYSFRGSQNA